VNAPNPTRQMTLVGKAGANRDFSRAGLPFPHQLDRTPQPQTHNVPVRSHADGAGEHASEMELTLPGDLRERGDLDGLVQMGNDIVRDARQHVIAYFAARTTGKRRCVAGNQAVDETGCKLMPE
jgi:hypothetical protein